MNRLAAELVRRVLVVQLLVSGLTGLLVAAFAPKLLLLDDAVLDGSLGPALRFGVMVMVFQFGATFIAARPLRSCLRTLGEDAASVAPADILTLYALPAKLVVIDVAFALLALVATLLPGLRPASNDLVTQGEIVLLAVTLGSVDSLLMYVTLRAAVARVMELVPEAVTRDAIAILELSPSPASRVRMRVLFAVALPVSFVALGASLLVFAHVRAFDAATRKDDALALGRGTLDLVRGKDHGRAEAAAAAALLGFDVRLDRERDGRQDALLRVDGTTVLEVPLADGRAVVRFASTRLTPATLVYAMLTLAFSALAALLGSRVGAMFVGDVALVKKEVRNLGVADVIRGTRVHRAPRFTIMGELASAIDDLGAIFREFASTQERAIDARAAAERMRGLFLASMSHDLKAPLNAILGFAELASRNPLTPSQRESLAIIEQRGRELLHLILTILDAARGEAGELGVTPEPARLGDVVMGAVVEARELVNEGDVTILTELQSDAPTLLIDGPRVTQALGLVILTGVRFAEQGLVRVRALVPEGSARVRIDVEVPGRGVPRADVEMIFEAFKDPERARRHGSLGLGLSLARSIIEQHGGTLEAKAMEKAGTVFHMILPVAPSLTHA